MFGTKYERAWLASSGSKHLLSVFSLGGIATFSSKIVLSTSIYASVEGGSNSETSMELTGSSFNSKM